MPIVHLPQQVLRLSLLASALLLAACGSDNSNTTGSSTSGSSSASVTPSLGKISNAAVEVRCMATGRALGSGVLGSTGSLTLSLSGSCSGPVLAELLASASTTYFDEKRGSDVALPSGTSLRAIIPTYTAGSPLTLAITPLTEIAARRAISLAGSEAAVTATQASTANSDVVTQIFGSGASLDILKPPTVIAAAGAGSLGTSDADRYAFYLAALAHLGAGSTPALAVLEALGDDLEDGSLSGASGTDISYTSSNFSSQLDAAFDDAAAYAGSELKSDLGLDALPPVAITGLSASTGAVGDEITLTGSGFDSDSNHLEVSFSEGVAATIISAGSTSLVVTVPAGAVSGPITVHHIISDTRASSASFTVTAGGGDPEPATWTQRSSPSSFILSGIAYGGSKFVAVGYNRTIKVSSDGISWSNGTAPDSNFYSGNDITWDGSQFVMVGDSSNLASYAPLIATSPDGVTWTRRSWTHGSETQLVDVAGNSNRLTAVGMNGKLISSTDSGVSWSAETLPAAANITELKGIADNGSLRVAVGRDSGSYGVILVNSGEGWTQSGSALSDFAPQDVIWTGSFWLIVGGNSFNYGADAVVMTSTDGSHWTRLALPTEAVPADFVLRNAVWTGSEIVAVGDNNSTKNIILTSANGSSWTQVFTSMVKGISTIEAIASSGSITVTAGANMSVTSP